MGLFSRNESYINESVTLPGLETESLYENKYDWTTESALQIVAENNINLTNTMKAVGIEELACFENGEEFFVEAAGGGVFSSIAKFLRNIWEKIKGIFRKFLAAFDSMTKTNKDFINKYKKYLMGTDILKNFTYSGYKFSNLDSNKTNIVGVDDYLKSDNITIIMPKMTGNTGNALKAICNPSALTTALTAATGNSHTPISDVDANGLAKVKSDIEDDWTDTTLPKIRGVVFTVFTGAGNHNPLEQDELSEELFTFYRSDDKEKQKLEESDISISDIISVLSSTDKTKNDTTKLFNKIKTQYEKDIKAFDKVSDAAIKAFPNKPENQPKDTVEAINYAATIMSRVVTAIKNNEIVCQNAWLKAMDDRAKQYKAICVAIVNRGTNVKTESYDFANEGGYLGNVKLI